MLGFDRVRRGTPLLDMKSSHLFLCACTTLLRGIKLYASAIAWVEAAQKCWLMAGPQAGRSLGAHEALDVSSEADEHVHALHKRPVEGANFQVLLVMMALYYGCFVRHRLTTPRALRRPLTLAGPPALHWLCARTDGLLRRTSILSGAPLSKMTCVDPGHLLGRTSPIVHSKMFERTKSVLTPFGCLSRWREASNFRVPEA